MENLIRCFIALDLPKEVKDYIKRVQKLLKNQSLFDGKLTEPENLHLTLKFLGEIDDNKLEEVKKRLKEIKFKEFKARLGEVGVFSQSFIKIVWIKLDGKGVFELQKQIDEKLRDLFEEEQRFMSHITIARVRSIGDKTGLLNYIKNLKIKEIKFNVSSFSLKKSELFESGPTYSDIEEYNAE